MGRRRRGENKKRPVLAVTPASQFRLPDHEVGDPQPLGEYRVEIYKFLINSDGTIEDEYFHPARYNSAMGAASAYKSDNDAQRRRLATLTEGLTQQQLNLEMPSGWTVATKLAHLAFWDHYARARLVTAQRSLFESVSVPVDEINAATRALSEAIAVNETVRMALAAADAVDRQVERLSDEVVRQIEASGNVRLLNRSLHRRQHLDEIALALNSSAGASL